MKSILARAGSADPRTAAPDPSLVSCWYMPRRSVVHRCTRSSGFPTRPPRRPGRSRVSARSAAPSRSGVAPRGAPIGPFFAPPLLRPHWHNSTPGNDPTAIELTGTIYDGARKPVPHAMIETWQPDPAATSNGHFTRTSTGSSGHYRLRTTRPRRTPTSADAAPRIALSLFTSGLNDRVSTRVYLADDPSGNATDPVLAALPADRRHTLRAHSEPSGPTTRYRFDITLQGNDETVFFLA